MNQIRNTSYADTIFYGGDIITVTDKTPQAEALAVKGETIIAVGDHEDVFHKKGPETRLIDLAGKTLMPGLVEPHSHPIISALLYNWVDVSGFTNPNGAAVMKKLREAAEKTTPGKWICAFGYDPILTRDLKVLNADLLDGLSSSSPIFVMVQTMHTVYVNHKAFELAGITRDTPQPNGGTFVKNEAGDLTGMVIEQGATNPLMAALLKDSRKDGAELMKAQLERYAQAGYTTVGALGLFPVFPNAVRLLKDLVERDDCPVRMLVMEKANDLERGIQIELGPGTDRFRVSGVKFWYDGSPYSGNMYLEAPFLNSDLMQTGLGVPRDTCGYSMMPKDRFRELVMKYHKQGCQIAVHGQGDRAIRDIVDVFEDVLGAVPREDHRHRIEHGALFTKFLIERAARLGLMPSWHINHIYYYGEALRDEILGPERTEGLMPMATALRYGLCNSVHNDSPMYPPEPFKLMRTAVTRKTRRNEIIGKNQAISVEEALRAVTLNAARQLFVEDKVGSLEVGKFADLVLVAENPFKIKPDRLDRIEVIGTYRGGRPFLKLNKS
jgi:predicted amidohydrolase YtcJ